MKNLSSHALQLAVFAALTSLALWPPVAAREAVPATPPPFFAFENTMRRGDKTPSNAGKAALLKELGYDGISTSAPSANDLSYSPEDEIAVFEKEGLKVFNVYVVLSFDSADPGPDPRLEQLIARLAGHDSALWIAIKDVKLNGVKLSPSSPEGDAVVVPLLRQLADLGRPGGVRIALYHHVWMWTERLEDTVRLARKAERPNIGATFNLCHWLKVVGDVDPRPALKESLPHLFFVSINGADSGDTKAMDWDRIIQPLGRGTYNVEALLRTLRDLGYAGPVGFQGYGIKGDSHAILSETMEAWRRYQSP